LRDDVTGEPLPAAVLPYAGRPMIEGLVRDLQAREYLYWRLTGRQITTPLAVMTSDAKGNHARITRLLERSGWFGRDPESFRLFRQPLVPVLSTEDGKWLMTAPCKPMMKPGGHGAIWKLMHDEGVFDWLRAEGARRFFLPCFCFWLLVLLCCDKGRGCLQTNSSTTQSTLSSLTLPTNTNTRT
jgi:hypothetical protein